MKAYLSILCVLVLTELASAVDYPIVAVKAPRKGDQQISSWQEVMDPIDGEPGSDLVIIRPDGTEEVLVEAGPDGMCMDPSPSLDGQWVFYAFVANQRIVNTQIRAHATLSGADIYKVNVATKEIVRLTNQEWTPAMGNTEWVGEAAGQLKHLGQGAAPGQSYLGYGIYNTGPCEVSGGRVIFTSSRNGYLSPKAGYTFPNLQLFAMDTDGKNVEQVGYLNIGSALHPTLMKDGSIMWSSSESQGLRNAIIWALWSSMPDGREWGPLMSGFVLNHAIHFQTQQPDGKIATAIYYINNNEGFGTIYRFPHKPEPPTDLHAFHSPTLSKNPVFKLLYGNTFVEHAISGFTPWGTEIVTSFANHYDIPSGPSSLPGNQRFGKVTHPAAAPDGLLMVYSPGPVNFNQAPFWPAPQGQIAILPYDKTAVQHPSELTIIREDPAFNYQQPRPLVSWKAIHGSDPVKVPWNPNDGTIHPKLPRGTPFGIVGTSSVYNRNSTANGQPGDFGTIVYQGGDVGTYQNSDIDAIRIVQQVQQPHRGVTLLSPGNVGPHEFTKGWRQQAPGFKNPNERMLIMGEIKLRKYDAEGEPILDAKGDPDTSFQARIPADVSYTFQLINKEGKALVLSQTWHQLRGGERRVNCGGCHAHAESPVDFNSTEAAKPGYQIVDLLGPPRDVEWHDDVKQIVEPACKACHVTNEQAKAKMDMTDSLVGFASKTEILQSRVSKTILAMEGQPPHQALAPQLVRTVAEWIDLGMGVDDGKYYNDDTNPTLVVQSPGKDEACTQVVVGAFDNQSGLSRLSVILNGQNISGQFTQQGNVWSMNLPQAVEEGVLDATAEDGSGNVARIVRTFKVKEPTPDPGPEPEPEPEPDPDLEAQIAALQAQLERVRIEAAETTKAAEETEQEAAPLPEPPDPEQGAASEYFGRDVDELGDLRSTTPDGKLDHHIRLTGLRGLIVHINIHADAIKWSDEAGEESAEFPEGKWWWVERKPGLPGISDIYFSDRETTGNFIVFPIYQDGSFDRLEVSPN